MRIMRAAAYLTCALIWGTTWFAIRVCIGEHGYPTLVGLALRFAIAVALLVPLALRASPWPRGPQLGWLVLAGALDAGAYVLVYFGEERVSGGLAAVVYGTQPLILAALLAITRMEVLTRAHLVGALVSLAGVGLLFADRLEVSTRQAIGVVLIVASVAVATSYSMLMKRHGRGIPGIVATTVFLGVTAVVLGIVALASGEAIPSPAPAAATIALAYLAVMGTVVAFIVYFWLLAETSLLVTSTLVFVYPLVALVTDLLFEPDLDLSGRAYLGAAITLGGLAVSLRRR
jgi:drug/metabolite transporter (DMT)-like permease